jgi:hypothetical protein
MNEAGLPKEMKTAIDCYLDLKRQAHDAGCQIMAAKPEDVDLPDEVQFLLLGDCFVTNIFANDATKYLIDLTVNFRQHLEAWKIGVRIKQNVLGAIKMQGPEEWPDIVDLNEPGR